MYRKAFPKALEKKENDAPSAKMFAVLKPPPCKEAILSIAPLKAPGKPNKPDRLRPSQREGLNIMYKLKDAGSSSAAIAWTLNVHYTNIRKVVYGQRRSVRIEAEVARILGKASWNNVVLEARSEILKKPIEEILQERKEKEQRKKEEIKKRMTEHISSNLERDIPNTPVVSQRGRRMLNRKAASL